MISTFFTTMIVTLLFYQAMTTASVPSTLVKCLYLFFDLPEMVEEEGDNTDANSEFTPKQRRILLQKIFVQVSVSNIRFV